MPSSTRSTTTDAIPVENGTVGSSCARAIGRAISPARPGMTFVAICPMMHACQSEENRSGGAPGAGGGRITRHRAARSAKIAVAAALDASRNHLLEWRTIVHAADQSIALLVARYHTSTALIAMPTSTRTRDDTR